MTAIQSIRENIEFTNVELNKFRKVVIKDEIQRLHINAAIKAMKKQLKDLKYSLECAIQQASK